MQFDDVDDQGRPLAVDASIDLSYRHLSADQARVFRLLASAPGPDVSTDAATVLIGQSSLQTRRILTELTRMHLLLTSPTDHDRWAMHDLVRLFADERGRRHAEDDQRAAAVTSLMSHYCTTAEAADTHLQGQPDLPISDLFPDRDSALSWLESEWPNLTATVISAQAYEHPAAASLAPTLYRFLEFRDLYADMLTVNSVALSTCRRLGDPLGEAKALNGIGVALRNQGRFEEAIDSHIAGADICRDIGYQRGEAGAVNNLGNVLEDVGRLEEAIDARTTAVNLFKAIGNRFGEGEALSNRGLTLEAMGRTERAIDDHATAVEIFQEIGVRHGEGKALFNLGDALQEVGRYEEAIDALTPAISLLEEANDHLFQAEAQCLLGLVLHKFDKFEEAIHAHTAAANLFKKLEKRGDEGIELVRLGLALRRLGRLEEAIDAHTKAAALLGEVESLRFEALALHEFGVCLEIAGRTEEALAAYTRATVCDPENPRILADRGHFYRLTGQHDEALADLNRSIELAPQNPSAITNRGVTLRVMGRYEESINDFNRSIELDPNSGWTHYEKGVALHALQDPECEVSLGLAIELCSAKNGDSSPDIADIGNLLLAHCAMSEWGKAEQYLTAFIRGSSAPGEKVELIACMDTLIHILDSDGERIRAFQKRLEDALGTR
ncbi:tetratricopeptide repeat protein [Streptomyces solicathayae]|uniref:Tetratricopeptide repeat protein n=1 Tax=Streptomyces solicathayae TaxID=3081768 RepID=A0ABZ0LK67_9ACTN|nr:tetratricopeptide repeat protein [Streptomyces sp. HUAS YS2]WOX19907.1 tetratricopeptide repeat protein [Streptomyces sp. HUAS YS2]